MPTRMEAAAISDADRPTTTSNRPAATVLQAADVSVELGGLPVLRGISLHVHTGEAVALMGGNGSGKSTLVRSLLGLTPLRRGAVQLFGTDLKRFSAWARVGYVPQRSTIRFSQAKVSEIVGSGRLAHRLPFFPPSRKDRQLVRESLEVVGLADRAKSELHQLSGGQQQRVLIARALAAEPELLVLDEPTAGVDLEHQQILADVLIKLRSRGLAILVVLHEVGPLTPLIDRAVVLRDGRIVHDGALPRSATVFHDHRRTEHGGHEHLPPGEDDDPDDEIPTAPAFPTDALPPGPPATGPYGGSSR